MRFSLRYILLCFVLTAIHVVAAAQDENAGTDSIAHDINPIRVSVLTCTAGDELYSKFGHTALLIRQDGQEDGVVLNYGCFNYDADSFVMNFVLGHTDYILDDEPYSRFIDRYGNMGVGVYEQELNLTEEETERLLQLLTENLLPENQMYRYNWLYNNCTEKARDVVEKAIGEKVVYTRAETDITVREMLRKCLENDPWESFGIDFILGEEIDRAVDKRVRMFIPAFYMDEMNEAQKYGEPLVKDRRLILQAQNIAEKPSFVLSPTFVFGALLVAVCLISIYEYRRRKNNIWLDIILHILQGLAGILIAFLFFFSEHPAVDSNWLVVIFNPIPLLYSAWLVYCKRYKKNNILAYMNLTVLAVFFVTMLVCRQSFNIATYFIVLSLLTRALLQSHNTYRRIR